MTFHPDESSNSEKKDACEANPHEKTVRLWGILFLLIGVVVSAALVAYHSVFAIAATVWRIGWGLGVIFIIQLSGLALNGFAWQVLLPEEKPGFAGTLIMIRWIRESINYLMPSAFLAGDVVAVRLLAARGKDINTVAASLVADKTLEASGLFFFALISIFLLLGQGGNTNIAHWAVVGLVTVLAVLAVFLMAQRWGLLKIIDKVVTKLVGKCGRKPGNGNTGIHDIVWTIYSDVKRLSLAASLHTLAWMPGTFQIWVALHFMGYKIGWPKAFIIESLSQLICAAAFVMPASLGAQEAAYMSAGMLFGIPPPAGLALSLVQRLKDVSFGISGLLAWQGFEGHRLWAFWRGRKHGNGNLKK